MILLLISYYIGKKQILSVDLHVLTTAIAACKHIEKTE